MQAFFCVCQVGVACNWRSVWSRRALYGLRIAARYCPMKKPLSMQLPGTAISICYAKFRQN